MKIEPKAIYTNLKNWDFATLGPYKLNEEEAEAIKEIYEQKMILPFEGSETE